MHGGALLVRSMRSTGLSSSHLVCGIVSGCRPCATAGSAYGETLSRVVTLAATSPHGGACGTPVPVPPQQPGQPSAAFSTGSNHRASDGESSSSPATAHSSAISAAAGGAATDDDGSPRARPEVCGRPSTYAHGLTHDHVSWVRHVLEDAEEELRARQRIVQHEARQAQLREAQASGLRVVVDCGFIHETAVNDKEVRSLGKQLERCAAHNRRAARPVSLHVTGFHGQLRDFSNYIGAAGWLMTRHQGPTTDLFPADELVVLSPDAPEPLLLLDPSKAYVVGGIVDRSVRKFITADFAAQHGLQMRRLPIQEHAEHLGMTEKVNKRPVLNVDNVVQALVDFNCSGDWAQALAANVPARKRRPQLDHKPRRPRPSLRAGGPDPGSNPGSRPGPSRS